MPARRSPSSRRLRCCRYFAPASVSGTGAAVRNVDSLMSGRFKGLGVTKGGFYRRFKNRRALLNAMLKAWARDRTAAIDRHTKPGAQNVRERLKSIITLYSERVNPEGMAVELALRQWARSDAAALRAVANVDAARLKRGVELYRALGLTAEEAEARAVLLYAFMFGRTLIVLDRPARKRARLNIACADALVGVAADGL
jgi:AcrR family transcriptional regulator